MKLHLGCGSVYLDDYINIDLPLKNHYLATARPDLVKLNKTTVDKYYKDVVTKKDILTGILQPKPVVVDVFSSITDLPFDKNSINEIRLVQVFEHFTFKEGKKVLKYWKTLLKKGGKLHLDVPDLTETIELYKTDPEWTTRLLFGSQKNNFGLHKSMYSKETIEETLIEMNYRDIKFLPNIHFYPAFAVEAIK